MIGRRSAILLAIFLTTAIPARGEEATGTGDASPLRGSFQVRFGESNPITRAHDVAGLSAGFVYGKYLGLDLSMDSYELFLDDTRPDRPPAKVAEFSILAIGPIARVRYPLLDGRLEPYLFAGGGIAIEEVNDRTAEVQLPGDVGRRTRGFGVFGGGVEYFFAENAAVGLEGRYFVMGSQEYDTEGSKGRVDLDVGVATLGLRVLVPQEAHVPPIASPRGKPRFSAALRVGGALPLDRNVFAGIRAAPEQAVLGSSFTTQFGASVGFDFNRWLGVDLAIENYEYKLYADGIGSIGEYALFPILVQPRVRLPGLPQRWEPYVSGGVGVEIAELNDKPIESGLDLEGGDTVVVGALGAGLEYDFASNASLGLSGRYVISRGHEIAVNGARLTGNLDAFVLSLGLKVLFGGTSF